jgi:GMP synthase (glutamine-hydrolysing)
MNVLVIKNIGSEGPGTIEEYLRQEKWPYSVIHLEKGEIAPHISTFTHLVIMGGPMAVYEMDQHPFLKDEALLIESAIKANKHVLGVCLGAQMVAHTLGARVYSGGKKEIGWYEVTLTAEGMQDPCISQLAYDGRHAARVFQWHGDTFDLPEGAKRMASSEVYPNQAFRYSDRVYALQFHIEVTPAIVFNWLKDEKGVDVNSVNAESNKIYAPYLVRAMNFYRCFFRS